MKFIVIPVCETNDKCKGWLENLLESIRKGEYFQKDYQVILCLDNCSESFQQYFLDKYKGLNIIAINNQNPKNLNFCKNVNMGLHLALQLKQDDKFVMEQVIVLNMDTVLPPVKVLDKVVSNNQGLTFPTPVGDTKDLQKSAPKKLNYADVLKYSGFCMIMSRKLIETIGVLDERFIAAFDDDDYSVRALLAGFKVQVANINVFHDMSDRPEASNTGAYNLEDLGLRRDVFRRKWSIPPNIPHEQFNQWILDNYQWNELFICK